MLLVLLGDLVEEELEGEDDALGAAGAEGLVAAEDVDRRGPGGVNGGVGDLCRDGGPQARGHEHRRRRVDEQHVEPPGCERADCVGIAG